MKINELLENIKNSEFELETGLEVKKYLPIELKKAIANGIIYECTDDSEGVIRVDSLQRYMSYVKFMITYHTNLEYTDEDYDVLCSTEYEETTLLNAIMACFGDDAKECSRVLDLIMSDYMQENTIEFTIARLLNSLVGSIDGIVNVINSKIEGLDLASMLPENMDVQQVMNFLEKYNM